MHVKIYICLKHRLISNKNLQASEFIFEDIKEFDCLVKPDFYSNTKQRIMFYKTCS